MTMKYLYDQARRTWKETQNAITFETNDVITETRDVYDYVLALKRFISY